MDIYIALIVREDMNQVIYVIGLINKNGIFNGNNLIKKINNILGNNSDKKAIFK
jgi:hypothetical protein